MEEIAEILHDAALEARYLVLELTEGIALKNPAAVKTMLMRLRALGMRVSVDDFGTGYSSLAYLRNLPLDSLKVDRSFIRGIEANGDIMSILAAVTGMGRQLGLQVVVEGVEKEEQLALIRSLDCGLGQGYLFSRPLDVDRMTVLLNTGEFPERVDLQNTDSAPTPLLDELKEGTPQRWWSVRNMRWGYVAAALVVLMVSAGIPRYLSKDPPPSAALASPDTPGTTGSAMQTARNGDIEVRAPADVKQSATPPAPAARPLEKSAAPRRAANVPVAAPPDADVIERSGPAEETRLAAVTTPASVRVVHQHRLGSCRGLLVVSGDAVTFRPDEHDGDGQHGFSLRHGQFLHDLGRDNLTIRSNDKVYRFKPADATDTGDNQFGKLVDAFAPKPSGIR